VVRPFYYAIEIIIIFNESLCIIVWQKRRKKARSYQVNRANTTASQPDLTSGDLLSAKDKQRIMTALVFLTCTLPHVPEVPLCRNTL
jgi:hypothetical protein